MPTLVTISVYLTETVALCNIYMFLYSTQDNGYGAMELWPWLVLSLLTFWGMHWLTSGGCSLQQLVCAGVVCFGVSGGVMAGWFIQSEEIFPWIVALFFLAVTTLRGCMLNLDLCSIDTVLNHCELPAMGVAFLLWMAEGGVFYLPAYYLIVSLVVLGVNILALSLARAEMVGGVVGEGIGGAQATTALCLVGVGGLAALYTKFVAEMAATAVATTTSFIAWLATEIYTAYANFMGWLLSLASTEGVEMPVMENEEITEILEVEMAEMGDTSILAVIGVVALVLACLALIQLFLRFRRMKLSRETGEIKYKRPEIKRKRFGFWRNILSFIQKKYSALRFFIWAHFHRNTPQGALVLLENLGEKRGVPRGRGESYRSYLERLHAQCVTQNVEGAEGLTELAEALDVALYSDKPTQSGPTSATYRAIRRAVAGL